MARHACEVKEVRRNVILDDGTVVNYEAVIWTPLPMPTLQELRERTNDQARLRNCSTD